MQSKTPHPPTTVRTNTAAMIPPPSARSVVAMFECECVYRCDPDPQGGVHVVVFKVHQCGVLHAWTDLQVEHCYRNKTVGYQ